MNAAVAEMPDLVRTRRRTTAKRDSHNEPKAPKRARIEVRVTEEVQKLAELVVAATGRSMTDVIVTALVKEARAVMEDVNVIKMNRDAQIAFAKALLAQESDPKPNEALQRAAEHHKRLIRSR